jgi:hypothetical protein
MRPVIISCACGLCALLAASCAHEKPMSAPGALGAGAQAAAVDSLAETTYDGLFMEMHLNLIKEIGIREQAGAPDTPLLEARSLVSASEELYLKGMPEAALRLLDEASRTLKQKR